MMTKKHNIYLVSDFTCETVCAIYRSIFAQFPNIKTTDHVWPLVNSERTIDKFIKHACTHPGIAIYTISNVDLAEYFDHECKKNHIVHLAALDHAVDFVSNYFHLERTTNNVFEYSRSNYYKRINAIEFTLNHDDGQCFHNLRRADIIIVGVSRTSKSPTSIYLSYRGYKVSNIPLVPSIKLPDEVFDKKKFVVGLTIDPEVLMYIRKKRITGYHDDLSDNKYTSYEEILNEIREAKQIFNQHEWPVIDVTKRSVEETASLIIKYYNKRQEKKLQEGG